jgi:NADH-quinone oxidoreductase subunit G
VTPAAPEPAARGGGDGLFRIGEVAPYAVDPLCRRSAPLQQTKLAADDRLGLNPTDAARLGLSDGDRVRVGQGGHDATYELHADERVPAGGVWLRSATSAARVLGPAVAPVKLEVA